MLLALGAPEETGTHSHSRRRQYVRWEQRRRDADESESMYKLGCARRRREKGKSVVSARIVAVPAVDLNDHRAKRPMKTLRRHTAEHLRR